MSEASDRVLFVQVPDDLYFRVKVDALRRDITLREWVTRAARSFLATEEELQPDGE